MRVKTTVPCLPSDNLEKSLSFNKEVIGFSDAKVEDDIIALELPHLSLFILSKSYYESYTNKADRLVLMPGASAPSVLSCAVETNLEVDRAINIAKASGGDTAGSPSDDPLSGGYTGYIFDPDGHMWELVCPSKV